MPSSVRIAVSRLLALAALWTLGACDSGPAESTVDGSATWPVIQSRILQPNCAQACHVAGTEFAQQSGLVLTTDVAYAQLADALPTNAAARREGLLRVDRGAETDLHASFLWEKINAPEQHNLLHEHPEYGALMPLGKPPLSYGELAFIRQWLLAGAPETGQVSDETLLADTARFRATSYEPLPLLSPEQGWSIRLGPFPVAPDFEREFFYFEPGVTSEERVISRMQMTMRPGSHHFILYTLSESMPQSLQPAARVIRDLRFENGSLNPSALRQMPHHVFFAGTQWPRMEYAFPPGVGLRLPAGTGFDLNSHYVNHSESPVEGEVQINLEYAAPGSVQHVADVLMLNNTQISLPPRQVTTLERTFLFDENVQIFQLFSHAHQHMIEFRVETVGGPRPGETVYRATDWAHPPILELDPPLLLNAGDGLRLVTTYNNWTDRTLGFGLLSEDEMMILFGYYYID